MVIQISDEEVEAFSVEEWKNKFCIALDIPPYAFDELETYEDVAMYLAEDWIAADSFGMYSAEWYDGHVEKL